MTVTTRTVGTTAWITPQGDIDHDILPELRAAVLALPPEVTVVVWDLHQVAFMDTAGLHLLFDPPPPDGPPRTTTVTGLRPQPLRLLLLARRLPLPGCAEGLSGTAHRVHPGRLPYYDLSVTLTSLRQTRERSETARRQAAQHRETARRMRAEAHRVRAGTSSRQ
ncbi:STAS domain-containing protein [Streptomyces sp. CRN 30]|uniref:STAS domain-containing protein n=1 Tax=Streptomyces sp. CRN 30 TaxID=3075613 RepID=UPI002A8174A3|nr:STAS domain-containing protein [Streptomyces sp. CRN 30]